MTNMYPLVTIGVPFFNAQKYIIETLESIRLQTYSNIQLVLLDDCSTDDSFKLVREWLSVHGSRFAEVALLRNEENKGTSYSCRRLQKAATGEFFAKLDADDIMLPEKTSRQVEFLFSHPDAALVYANTQLIDSEGRLLKEDYFAVQKFRAVVDSLGPSGFVFHQLIVEDFIPNSSVLIRRNRLEEIGGYDETLFTEDWDLWLRICKKHPVLFMQGYFSQYRIHPQSVMRKRSSLVKNYLSCIKAVMKHRNISKQCDQIIATHLNTYAVGMYRLGVIEKEFLKKNFLHNKTLKSAAYYLLGLLNIKVNQAE